ncbi:MAG: amidohydrolase [Candidatus Wallbacteria bacterium]|nr:amidohydrolase [Candidatus Wallbacteria bacterium]
MVIDIHVHVQPLEMMKPACRAVMEAKHPDFERIAALAHDPARFVALMDAEGIGRVGIINYVAERVMGFTHEVNDWAARYARDHRDRLLPFGSIDPTSDIDPAREMDRIVEHLRLPALKLHPPHQLFHANQYRQGLTALETVYRKAQEARLPVMIHTGTSIFPGARNIYADPMAVDDVAVDFPELPIILAHGGRPLYMQTAAFLVRRHKNVWMDISGIPPQSLLDYFPRLEQLSDRVLWGSDWPGPMVPGMAANLGRFLALPLSEAARLRILHENAEKLFRLA